MTSDALDTAATVAAMVALAAVCDQTFPDDRADMWVPSLAAIDLADPAADHLALAAVCRHVGGAS